MITSTIDPEDVRGEYGEFCQQLQAVQRLPLKHGKPSVSPRVYGSGVGPQCARIYVRIVRMGGTYLAYVGDGQP